MSWKNFPFQTSHTIVSIAKSKIHTYITMGKRRKKQYNMYVCHILVLVCVIAKNQSTISTPLQRQVMKRGRDGSGPARKRASAASSTLEKPKKLTKTCPSCDARAGSNRQKQCQHCDYNWGPSFAASSTNKLSSGVLALGAVYDTASAVQAAIDVMFNLTSGSQIQMRVYSTKPGLKRWRCGNAMPDSMPLFCLHRSPKVL